jgi:hypothetical protein
MPLCGDRVTFAWVGLTRGGSPFGNGGGAVDRYGWSSPVVRPLNSMAPHLRGMVDDAVDSITGTREA